MTLKADRAAVDARLVLKNPNDKTIPYEYWTCTTLAPGSDPNNPKTTGGAEIIAPIAAYRTPAWSKNMSEGDASAGAGTSRFEKLRYFRNWPTMGIAYAAPDMQGGNFWGVINHDNEEGIIRIADNTVTPRPENVDVGISLVHERNRPAQGSEPGAALCRIMGGRVGRVFPQRRISGAERGVDSGNLQPDRRHEQRDACEREHPDQSCRPRRPA